eukprot:TRINITY_DN7569_c0_g1_i1.p2 TRINITY_DN7569_c0_g1~~TRINITY_DN7569_c0_g1_i1.p2  ORF type:complete len:128 (-),score=27.97 TRINITY_DN7569_c0_g1_i1:54-437(-)
MDCFVWNERCQKQREGEGQSEELQRGTGQRNETKTHKYAAPLHGGKAERYIAQKKGKKELLETEEKKKEKMAHQVGGWLYAIMHPLPSSSSSSSDELSSPLDPPSESSLSSRCCARGDLLSFCCLRA